MTESKPPRPQDEPARMLGAALKAASADIVARIESARHGQHELREEVRSLREQVSLLRSPDGPDPWFDKMCALLERLEARAAADAEAVQASFHELSDRAEAIEARCSELEKALRASAEESAAKGLAAAETVRRELGQAVEASRDALSRGLEELSAKTESGYEAARLERQTLLEEVSSLSQAIRAIGAAADADRQSREQKSGELAGSLRAVREAVRQCAEAVRAEGERTAALVERLDSAARERANDQLRLAMLQVVEEVAAVRKAIPQAADKEELGFKLLELKQTLGFLLDAMSKLGRRLDGIEEISERKRLMRRLDEVAKSLAAMMKSLQDVNPR